MGRMNQNTFRTLFEYGKKVYNGTMDLSTAATAANAQNPEVATSSARHYIQWYSKMRTGDFLTWNSNSELLLYYVSRIIEEEGSEAGKLAIQAAKQFARHHARVDLEQALNKLGECNDINPASFSEAESPETAQNREKFKLWLAQHEKGYKPHTIYKYVRALDEAEEWLSIDLPHPIFAAFSVEALGKLLQLIRAVPNFEEINQAHGHGDLSAALTRYQEYLADDVSIEDGEKEMTTKEKLDKIKEYIAAKGFVYKDDLVENFYLSLKSKPFVILAGTSGTGKTKLVQYFAEAIGAEMLHLPVRPDWSDSSDLFGHSDLSSQFHPGAVLNFIQKAKGNPNTPHMLCLDEMNLARVEYYFSDFLSIIETRTWDQNRHIITKPLIDKDYYKSASAAEEFGVVSIPENFYIVGTVNMDETTFPFSKKVLDRANTIEFSVVNLTARPKRREDIVAQTLDNTFLKANYLHLIDCDDEQLVTEICEELQAINQVLEKANLHVGYRVRDEIVFYMLNRKKADLLTADSAFDHEIMQKILPRIQGSSTAIKVLLHDLFVECAGDYAKYSGQAEHEKMSEYLKQETPNYPNSAKKIAFMMRRYEEDGFTSYWL